MTACFNSDRLCVLNETQKGITYLTSVALGDYPDSIGNGDYFLLYSTGYISDVSDLRIGNSYLLHVIPENGRFKFEVILTSSVYFVEERAVGHAEPTGEWEPAGYSDDDSEAAKVLAYFTSMKNKKRGRPRTRSSS